MAGTNSNLRQGHPCSLTVVLTDEILTDFMWINKQVQDFLPRSSVLPEVRMRDCMTNSSSFSIKTMTASMYEFAHDLCTGVYHEYTTKEDFVYSYNSTSFIIKICLLQLYQQSINQKNEIGFWYKDLFEMLSGFSDPSLNSEECTSNKAEPPKFKSPSPNDLTTGFEMLVSDLVNTTYDTVEVTCNQVQAILNNIRGKVTGKFSTLNPTHAEIGFYILCVYCKRMEVKKHGNFDYGDNMFTKNLELMSEYKYLSKPLNTGCCFIPIWTRPFSRNKHTEFLADSRYQKNLGFVVDSVKIRGCVASKIIRFDNGITGLKTAVATSLMNRAHMTCIPHLSSYSKKVMYAQPVYYRNGPALLVIDNSVYPLAIFKATLTEKFNIKPVLFSVLDSVWQTAMQIALKQKQEPEGNALGIEAYAQVHDCPVYMPLSFLSSGNALGNPDSAGRKNAGMKRGTAELDLDFHFMQIALKQKHEPGGNALGIEAYAHEHECPVYMPLPFLSSGNAPGNPDCAGRKNASQKRGTAEMDLDFHFTSADESCRKVKRIQGSQQYSHEHWKNILDIFSVPEEIHLKEEIEKETEEYKQRNSIIFDVCGLDTFFLSPKLTRLHIQSWCKQQRKTKLIQNDGGVDLCGLKLSDIRTMLQDNAEKSYSLHPVVMCAYPQFLNLRHAVETDISYVSEIIESFFSPLSVPVVLSSLVNIIQKL